MTDILTYSGSSPVADMVRKAAQANHQPILNDGRIEALLQRLSHAEQDPHGKAVRTELGLVALRAVLRGPI